MARLPGPVKSGRPGVAPVRRSPAPACSPGREPSGRPGRPGL